MSLATFKDEWYAFATWQYGASQQLQDQTSNHNTTLFHPPYILDLVPSGFHFVMLTISDQNTRQFFICKKCLFPSRLHQNNVCQTEGYVVSGLSPPVGYLYNFYPYVMCVYILNLDVSHSLFIWMHPPSFFEVQFETWWLWVHLN